MRAEVILVRHAQPYTPRAGGPDDYHRPLTQAGVGQAEGLVAELVQARPELIVSSPYLRAVQTVEPAARALRMAVHTDHRLREWDSGLDPTPDYARHYAASWATPHLARPDAESLHQLGERATAVLHALARRHHDQTVLVASHGTFIASALAALGVPGIGWAFSHAIPTPAIYRLHFTSRDVRATGPGLGNAQLRAGSGRCSGRYDV